MPQVGLEQMQEQLQRITKLETELASLNQRFSEWADTSPMSTGHTPNPLRTEPGRGKALHLPEMLESLGGVVEVMVSRLMILSIRLEEACMQQRIHHGTTSR